MSLNLISKHKTAMVIGVVLLAHFINPAAHKAENSELNFHARYYGAMPARFFGRDRVRLEDDPVTFFQINPYQFTRNNPIKNIDQDGNKDFDVWKFSRTQIMGKITEYGTEYAGNNPKKGYETDFSKRSKLVCNEVPYFSAKEKYPTFPYVGAAQDDWFKQRGELYDVNSSEDLDTISNFGGGDEIFMYDKKGNFRHALQINDYDSQTKTFSVMGAHTDSRPDNQVGVTPGRYTVADLKTYWGWQTIKIGSFGSSKEKSK